MSPFSKFTHVCHWLCQWIAGSVRLTGRASGTLLVLAIAMLAVDSASACTAFSVVRGDDVVVGRNFDWYIGRTQMLINPRGLAKRALSLEKSATWTSEYGSVTINQYGRELPCEGINETGLVITALWLGDTTYPKVDDRPVVTSGQWIQYQLDTAGSVADVIDSDDDVRITGFGGAKLHYFVADKSGDCAVIEFLDGKLVVHRGRELATRAITNSCCAESLEHVLTFKGKSGKDLPHDASSLARCVRAADGVSRLATSKGDLTKAAFDVLDDVANPKSTQWQVAYDLDHPGLSVRTRGRKVLRTISLADIDFAGDAKAQVVRLDDAKGGDLLPQFQPYTTALNREQIEYSFPETDFARSQPAWIRELVIRYPEAMTAVPVIPAQ